MSLRVCLLLITTRNWTHQEKGGCPSVALSMEAILPQPLFRFRFFVTSWESVQLGCPFVLAGRSTKKAYRAEGFRIMEGFLQRSKYRNDLLFVSLSRCHVVAIIPSRTRGRDTYSSYSSSTTSNRCRGDHGSSRGSNEG